MTSKEKIRELMRITGMDTGRMAAQLAMKPANLSKIMMGEYEIAPQIAEDIDRLIILANRCPDCMSRTTMQSGCLGCTCGWGLCG